MNRALPDDLMPQGLAARPRDPRGLPIPPVNVQLDGSVDFTNINTGAGVRLAWAGRCTLCALPMGRLVGFLGGPKAAEIRAYSDPPACPGCLKAALLLCPHIRHRDHRRRSDRPGQPAGIVPDGFNDTKPGEYHLVTARTFEIVTHPRTRDPIYLPGPYVTVTRYGYDTNGNLDTDSPLRGRR